MRVLVCGGRDYGDRNRAFAILDAVKAKHGDSLCIIHGAASGADSIAEVWAKRREVPYVGVPAEWAKHNKGAGPKRNAKMLAEWSPNACVAFPGGPGTADMVRRCKAAGIPVMEVA